MSQFSLTDMQFRTMSMMNACLHYLSILVFLMFEALTTDHGRSRITNM